MKAPCSALGTLPHLSEFSAHTYPLQLQAGTVLSLWAGRSVEGQPDGCLHSSLLAPIRSFALGISCPGHQPPLSFECSCFHFQQVFLSVLDCGFSPPLCSQCFRAFQGFLVSSPWRLFLLIWQNSCEFLFFFFSFLSFFFFFLFYGFGTGGRSYSLTSLLPQFNLSHHFFIPQNHAICLVICLYISKTIQLGAEI